MTHAEILSAPGHGLPPSDCPGHLVYRESHEDVAQGRLGPATPRTIALYTCDRCGHVVSVAHDRSIESIWSELDGTPLNSYDPSRARLIYDPGQDLSAWSVHAARCRELEGEEGDG